MTPPRPIGRVFAALLAAGLASACSLLIDVGPDQCSTDGDCVARGTEFAAARCVRSACVVEGLEAGPLPEAGPTSEAGDAGDAAPSIDPRYACLGKNPAPVPTKKTAAYQVTLTDLLSQAGVPNLRVKICPNLTDPSCTTPSSTTTTDAQGVAKLTIDISGGAFDGYVDVVPETADGGSPPVDGSDQTVYMPSRIYYTSIPIAADRVDDYQVLRFSALVLFGSLFKAKADFTTGAAFLIAEDCTVMDSADRVFAVDQKGTSTESFYLKNDQPSTTATMTDPSGIGGYVNLPTGARHFTSTLAGSGKVVGELTGYVRPATILLAKIGPAYAP
jgi:hypothetical protein